MFEEYDKVKLEQLKEENDFFYSLAVKLLKYRKLAITPFSVKRMMIELESLAQSEDLKEVLESDNIEHKAYVYLQTGDISQEEYNRLLELGLLDEEVIKKISSGQIKMFPKRDDLEAPVISIQSKSFEEKLTELVKAGVYSQIEVGKMIQNGLIDKELLHKYYDIYGLNRDNNKPLTNVFKPLMTFEGVRLSNDDIIDEAVLNDTSEGFWVF